MEAKTISIKEKGLSMNHADKMINTLIDSQINHYKLQFMNDWEKNHDLSPKKKDERIEFLRNKKQELKKVLEQISSEDADIDINISIDLKVGVNNMEMA